MVSIILFFEIQIVDTRKPAETRIDIGSSFKLTQGTPQAARNLLALIQVIVAAGAASMDRCMLRAAAAYAMASTLESIR